MAIATPTTSIFRFPIPSSGSLHNPKPISPSSLNPPRLSFTSREHNLLRRSHSGEAQFSTIKVSEPDHSFAVKKKASDISPGLKGTSLFLVGVNNSIKTNLGKLLADVFRYYYFDSDCLVWDAAGGEAAAKAFREADEKGFRDIETEVLRQLSSMGRLVVCAGDGAVQSSTNLSLLRHGISVHIDVPLDIVAEEIIKNNTQVGSKDSEVLTELNSLYEKAKEGYAIADASVSLQKVANKVGCDDLTAVTAQDMAIEVLIEVEKLTRVKKMMEEAARPF